MVNGQMYGFVICMMSICPEVVSLPPVTSPHRPAGIGVGVMVGVSDAVGVNEGVEVSVMVGVNDAVGVLLGVSLTNGVGVSVGVSVNVLVAVGVFVIVAVGVGGIQVLGGSVTTIATLTRIVRALSARTGFPVSTDRRMNGTMRGTTGLKSPWMTTLNRVVLPALGSQVQEG